MSFLLDTNVISEARKPGGNPNVRAWLASVKGVDLYLSVLVVGEIRQGIERLRRRDPTQAQVYETWLATLRQDYPDRILSITKEVTEEWGRLNVPNAVPVVDGLMAATARVQRPDLRDPQHGRPWRARVWPCSIHSIAEGLRLLAELCGRQGSVRRATGPSLHEICGAPVFLGGAYQVAPDSIGIALMATCSG